MVAKILIVEDDLDILEAMRLPLEAKGYEIHYAARGKEALERVKGLKPDLIILDVMMESDREGFRVAYQLRNPDPRSEYAECSKIPILVLTAIGPEKGIRFSRETAQEPLPLDGLLEKPVRLEVLLDHVAALLKIREKA